MHSSLMAAPLIPQVDKMVVMNGLYFALRSGDKHGQLRSSPYQIRVIERPGRRAYLEYVEDASKNRPGGLKGRKLNPKIVQHHDNPENPSRCFVRLFKLYQIYCQKIGQVVYFFSTAEEPLARLLVFN